ncbi:MAG: cysteine hydrolase [Mycobacterium sp.]
MADRIAIHPRHTALLVMDYQTGILTQLADSDRLVGRVKAAVNTVRGRGGHVGWVRVAFTPSDLSAIPETSIFADLASRIGGSSLRDDAPDTQFHPELTPLPNEVAVRKTRVGAFTTTDLDRQLRDRDVTTLVLAGVSTSGVVLSTVREAMDRDYRIVVLKDACADREQATHDFLTGTLFPAAAHVTTSDHLDSLWG